MRDGYLSAGRAIFTFFIVCSLFALFQESVFAQSQTAPVEGMRNNTPQVHALTNARIVTAPGQTISRGTIIIRDGVIEAVGDNVRIPADAHVWDYTGLTVYAGLIETYSQVGLPGPEKRGTPPGSPSNAPPAQEQRGVAHWNASVHPQDGAVDQYAVDDKALKALRGLGFTVALVAPDRGIFTGSSVLVSLGGGAPHDNILQDQVAQHIRYARNRNRTYPGSLMGVIALIRQTFLDTDWYEKAHEAVMANPAQNLPEENEALEALRPALRGQQPVMMSVTDDQTFLRADKIAKEFGLKTWIHGSGQEYRMLDLIKATGAPVFLPVNFPQADDFQVSTTEEALGVPLMDLRHWEAAPENPGRLQAAGVPFTLTSAGLKKPSDFHVRVRQAIERGLDYDAALAAVTTTPASLLGMSRQLGTIEPGKLGHLTVTDGPLFAENVKVREVWVAGDRYEVNPKPVADPRGTWGIKLSPPGGSSVNVTLKLKGSVAKINGTVNYNDDSIKLQKAMMDQKRLSLVFPGDKLGFAGIIRMSGGVTEDAIRGQGELPDGRRFAWSGSMTEGPEMPEQPMPTASNESALPMVSPPGAFGRSAPPEQPRHVLVRGATVWTLDDRGKIENADMLVTNGKITRIGQNLSAPTGATIIDGNGKHVTPGLIDAHSHSGIAQGINEGTQAVTAEVSVGDVVENYQIALYRELAGGLTAANQLHGSSNPIGGQNNVIKLRWGASPDGLNFEGAIPGIKFALGENVKRSNSTGPQRRYPATRMGVEQLVRDRFRAAQDYDRGWKQYNALGDKTGVIPPRKDLELDTLLQILRGERLVHSHSYRQDEILSLIRIADDFGFTIGTFQHVLEGYKVADAIAKHGAGASTFSDWWGYKMEAYDAIPYNGALMHNAGVLVTFNSDSGELARRLNTEAAKAVKYGGVDQVEALKFVTLNAAKQLRVDDQVGSLEPGKDADFVIWNGHPLSTYTLCEQTWIEGRKYFDIDEDQKMREQVKRERTLLIQKLLKPKDKAPKGPEAS